MKESLAAEKRGYDFLVETIENRFNEMVKEDKCYWMMAENFNTIILQSYFFDNTAIIPKIIELAEKYYSLYTIKKDPWWPGDKHIHYYVDWGRFVFGLTQNKFEKKYLDNYMEYQDYLIKNIRINKSNAAEIENHSFLYWLAGREFDFAYDLLNICERKLLKCLINILYTKTEDDKIALLKDFIKYFNTNRNNILFNIEHGIPQILFYYKMMGDHCGPVEIVNAQMEGLKKI